MIRTLLLLAFSLVPVMAAAQSETRVVKPEIRAGDRWTYRGTGVLSSGADTYETRVEHSDGKTILAVSTRRGDGKEFDSTWSPGWNPAVTITGFINKPVPEIFSYPMQVGAKWTVSYLSQQPRSSTPPFQSELTVTVAGWEEISVPAGKFRALKIVADGTIARSDAQGTARQQMQFWYVPEVRRWVKYQLQSSTRTTSEELLEYKLNED